MMLPAESKFDYVRVYRRKGRTNTGCNPTAKYIADHLQVYTGAFAFSSPFCFCFFFLGIDL